MMPSIQAEQTSFSHIAYEITQNYSKIASDQAQKVSTIFQEGLVQLLNIMSQPTFLLPAGITAITVLNPSAGFALLVGGAIFCISVSISGVYIATAINNAALLKAERIVIDSHYVNASEPKAEI